MDDYTVMGRIGEGAHGVVVQARSNLSGKMMALKKVPLRRLDQGMPATALREIKALQELNCENILPLLDVFAEGTGFVLVFDYMRGDLGEILRDADCPLTPAVVKTYMKMILLGADYLHKRMIMHRDLKPANLLINERGVLKIADFGLCRVFSRNERLYSHQVATRWYRAPELLYGARIYDEGVDLWSIGCVFGEMLNNSPLFPGESDIDQLGLVLRCLGTPSQANWPGVTKLPDYKKITFPKSKATPFERVLPDAPPDAVDLIKKFLLYDSKRRISSEQALIEDYFFAPPLPEMLSQMPRPPPEKLPPPASKEIDIDFPNSDFAENVWRHLTRFSQV